MNKKILQKIFGLFFLISGILLLLLKLTLVDQKSYILNNTEMVSQLLLSLMILGGLYLVFTGFQKEDNTENKKRD